jgi:20S proteasome alpha/beta subunit
MTLILAAFVTDGIVLAGDSRGTLTSDATSFVEQVDNIHKIFLTSDNIGVAYTGNFSKEKTITQLFEDFTSVNKSKNFNSPDELAKAILKHYVNLVEKPDIRMIIAGYDKTSNPVTQQYCQIEVSSGRGFTNTPSYSQVVIDGDGAEILGSF